MGYQRESERWIYRHPAMARLLGVVTGAVTAGTAAGALVLVSAPPAEYEYVPPPAAPVDPVLAPTAAHCEKGADTFGDVARAVMDAGGLRAPGGVSELRDAEARMTRRTDVPSARLTATFGEAETSLRDLRRAIEDGDGVESALDATLDLMDLLGQQCHDVLLSAGGDHPG